MRTMSTHMGATGNDGRTEGMPEVQESLLEHATPKACQEKGVKPPKLFRDILKGAILIGTEL